MARYQREIDELSIHLSIHNSNHAVGEVEMSDDDDEDDKKKKKQKKKNCLKKMNFQVKI